MEFCDDPAEQRYIFKINRRRNWHPGCMDAGRMAVNSGVQRAACFARDRGVCARCGKDTVLDVLARYPYLCRREAETSCRKNGGRYWQADHILPLIESAGRLEYFTLANLQTLCTACHVIKGKEDNARRRNALPNAQPSLL